MENRVDLNLADVVALTKVPGVGPTLASRIIAYREEHGPFLLSEEVTAVSGIGPATYEEMRDHITATLPDELPLPNQAFNAEEGEEAMTEKTLEPTEETEGKPLVTPPEPEPEIEEEEQTSANVEGALPTAEEEHEVDQSLSLEEPEKVEGVAEYKPALPPPEPEPLPEPEPEPEQAPPAASSASESRAPLGRRLWLTGVLAAFVGGLFGMLFALLVFAGLNGSLDLNQTTAVVGLRTELEAAAAEAETLRQDVAGLRERLDALEGLTARMEKAESALDSTQEEVSTLNTDVAVLQEDSTAVQEEVATLSEDIATVTEEVEKATTFFARLRTLVIEVFGAEPAATTPESDE
jgi:competence ComEA-like helix-hairpin-helix protein